MSLFSWVGNTATSALLDAGFLKLYERFSANEGIRKGVTNVTNWLTKDNSRDKVWSFVLVDLPAASESGEAASKKIVARQKLRQHTANRTYGSHSPYRHGDEDKLLEILAVIYASCADEKGQVKKEELTKVLTALGNMADKSFDTVIEGFDNDRMIQKLLRVWNEATALYQRFNKSGERQRDQLLRHWNYRI